MTETTLPSGGLPDWRSVRVPADLGAVATMLTRAELKLLYALARDHYTGEGSIVDAGCFLGGSTLCFARGVSDNPRVPPAKGPVIHSYDLFVVEPWTIGLYFPKDTPLGTSFLPRYEATIAPVADLVAVHAGDITAQPVPDGPIEILFVDVAKTVAVGDHVIRAFFPRLIPGRSLVIQQDYLYHQWNGWIHVAMEALADHFELLDHTDHNSVVFRCTKPITPEIAASVQIGQMSAEAIRALSDRAIARFSGPQRRIVADSAAQFQRVLDGTWSDDQPGGRAVRERLLLPIRLKLRRLRQWLGL